MTAGLAPPHELYHALFGRVLNQAEATVITTEGELPGMPAVVAVRGHTGSVQGSQHDGAAHIGQTGDLASRQVLAGVEPVRLALRWSVVSPAEIKQSRTGCNFCLANTQEGNHLVLIDALVACYRLDDGIQGTDSQTAVIWNCNTLMRRAFGF